MSETLLDRIEAERADQDRRQAQALEGFAHCRPRCAANPVSWSIGR